MKALKRCLLKMMLGPQAEQVQNEIHSSTCPPPAFSHPSHTHTHTHTQPYCISLKFLSDHMSILNVLHWLPLFSDYSLKTPTWIWCPVYCPRPLCSSILAVFWFKPHASSHWWLHLSTCTCTSHFVTILMLIIHYFTSVFPITRG